MENIIEIGLFIALVLFIVRVATGEKKDSAEIYREMILKKKKSLSRKEFNTYINTQIAEGESLQREMESKGKKLHPLNKKALDLLRQEKEGFEM